MAAAAGAAAAGAAAAGDAPVIPFTISSATREGDCIKYIINGYEVSVNTGMPAGPAVGRWPVVPSTRGRRRSRKIRRKSKNQTRRK